MVTPGRSEWSGGSKSVAMAERIAREGFGIMDDFVEGTLVASLVDDVERGWRDDRFQAAKVGQGRDKQRCPSVRGDWIAWLEDDGMTTAQMRYRERLERLRMAINRETMMGLFGWEGHFAFYPQGSAYRRHLDVFKHARDRQVSTILYLNEGWEVGDGGELRLYMGKDHDDYIDIAPRAGTLVAFMSERFYHEVRPARRERRSITGWFRRRS